ARESGGSMRDATSLLDQVLAFADGRIDAAAVAEALGLPDVRAIRELVAAVARRDPAEALAIVGRVHAQGTDAGRFCEGVLTRLRHLAVAATVAPEALADLSAADRKDVAESARGLDPSELQRWFRILLDAFVDLSRAPSPRLVLEMAVLRMATLVPIVPLDDLVSRLEAIELGQGAARPAAGRSGPRASASVPASLAGVGAKRNEEHDDAPARPATATSTSTTNGAGTAIARDMAAFRSGAGSDGEDGSAGVGGAAEKVAESGPHQERWQRLVDGLQRERASRFFRLSYSRVVDFDDDSLRVAVTGREAANALLERDAREAIEAAIAREFERPLRFVPVVPGETPAAEPARVDRATLDRQA